MKKIDYLLLLVLLLFFNNLHAQKQNYNWFFGYNAGLTWKTPINKKLVGINVPDDILTDLPSNIAGSPMQTWEGCFSISDVNGDLLFYSDGSNVWNKNKSQLTGAILGGNKSSAQSGTIVVYPNNINKYIALYLGEHKANNLGYRIINVDPLTNLATYENTTTSGNVLFTGQQGFLGESVTVGRDINRKDLWVLAPGRSTTVGTGSNYLNVWKIDETGPITTLHSSFEISDPNFKTNTGRPGGYIRFTNNSESFAWINGENNNISICYGKFNNSTGIITDVKIKPIPSIGNSIAYGVEFSNDGKYLYVTLAPDNYSGFYASSLIVYDFNQLLSKNTQTLINAIVPIKQITTSNSTVQNEGFNHFGSIQTGPDGRMYISKLKGANSNSIYVIDNPKDPVNLRMYRLDFNLGSQYAYWGLPNFAVPWYNTFIELPLAVNQTCANKSIPINFYVVDGEGFDALAKIEIDFGDNTNKIVYKPVTSGIKNESHTYKYPGFYRIKVTSFVNGPLDVNGSPTYIEKTNVTKTIVVNTCSLKVNPFIRGELFTN